MANKKQQTVYSFGSSLRRAREKREYTREQIAERAGISPRFVSAIENDRRKPSLDVLIRLVHSIGVILSRLVDTFISKISLTMLPVPKPHNTACVLSWEEARRWQSRSSGYSSS